LTPGKERILKDRLVSIFEWYKGMVDEESGRLIYLRYPEENLVSTGRSPIREEIASIWDLAGPGGFKGHCQPSPRGASNKEQGHGAAVTPPATQRQ
jgi:hypothetical protein